MVSDTTIRYVPRMVSDDIDCSYYNLTDIRTITCGTESYKLNKVIKHICVGSEIQTSMGGCWFFYLNQSRESTGLLLRKAFVDTVCHRNNHQTNVNENGYMGLL